MKKPLVFIILSLVIGIILVRINTKEPVSNTTSEISQQSFIEDNTKGDMSSVAKLDGIGDSDMKTTASDTNIKDNYVRIVRMKGGSFLMGSSQNENWRSDDEEQHKVEVSPFFIFREV